MYAFEPGEKAVHFVDRHGLTRLELPPDAKKAAKLKTDRKTQLEDMRLERLLEKVGLQPSVEHPDATRLDGVDLWASRDVGYYRPHADDARVDPASGATASICSPNWEWELHYSGPEGAWTRPLSWHGGRPHRVYPHASGLVVAAVSPRDRVARVARFDAAGAQIGDDELPSCTIPVAAGARLAWQRDEDTVVVREASGEERTFSIAAVTETAHAAKKHPRAQGKAGDWLGDLDNAGRGEILLGEEAVLYLPWHGETVLDLVAAREFHRKLPQAEHNVRRRYCEKVERAARFGAAADVWVEGVQLEIKKGSYPSFWVGVRMTFGDGGIKGVLVTSAVAALFTEDESDKQIDVWRGGGGSVGGHDYLTGTGDEAELLETFQIFDEHAVHLSWALWQINSVYERRLESDWGSANHHDEVLGRVMTKEAEKIFLQAFLESTAGAPNYGEEKPRPTLKLMDHVDGWRAADLEEGAFLERAKEVQKSNIDEDFFQRLAKSWFHDGPWRE
jgi:hypothetical protein